MAKKNKIGLFFGSFNPIHVGHLIIANFFIEYTDISNVWFVISPHNPLKEKKSLLPDYHRLAIANIAIEENPKTILVFGEQVFEIGLGQAAREAFLAQHVGYGLGFFLL